MGKRGPNSNSRYEYNGKYIGFNAFASHAMDASSCEFYWELNPDQTLVYEGKTLYFDHWILDELAKEVGLSEDNRGCQLSEPYDERVPGGIQYVGVYVDKDPEEPEETKFKIIAKASPSLGGTTRIDGAIVSSKICDKGKSCRISVTEAEGWKFLYWENSFGEKVYLKTHSFIVTRHEVWIAWMKERVDTQLIVHMPEGKSNAGKIVYHTDGKILRDEH